MLLERTISQLDIGYVSDAQARELACLGYLQWLGGLPGHRNYVIEARRAHDLAAPFAAASPAVREFCLMLLRSLERPMTPMDLRLPHPARRGGARARRNVL